MFCWLLGHKPGPLKATEVYPTAVPSWAFALYIRCQKCHSQLLHQLHQYETEQEALDMREVYTTLVSAINLAFDRSIR